jgi:hypothetical protein
MNVRIVSAANYVLVCYILNQDSVASLYKRALQIPKIDHDYSFKYCNYFRNYLQILLVPVLLVFFAAAGQQQVVSGMYR